ncbi:MAG: 2-dehydro-3-deoxygalactonokinase [Psychromonas sp.]
MHVITIDTGTTNSRVLLWKNDQLVDQVKNNVGVRNTSVDGHNGALVQAIKEALQKLLIKHDLQESEIKAILASGMITSNLGLVEVPHLIAPVSVAQFVSGIHTQIIPEISESKIHFIPGVKNLAQPEASQLSQMDIMRGEEVEAIAIACEYDLNEDAIIALPGSHSKFVGINKNRDVLGCCTTLTGELNAIITQNTILTSSLGNKFTDELDVPALIMGANESKTYGLGKALFSIRVREQFGKWNHSQLASFLVGILVQSDIDAMTSSLALNHSADRSIYVGGKGVLCQATAELIKHHFPEASVIECNTVDNLSARGAIYLAKKSGII